VGGGSAIDTGKAVNLLTCHPAPLLDYVNKPVGGGRPVPGPLKPLIAMPTTAGTGSETTAVLVTHVVDQHVKAGVSNRLLRPTLGVVDPLNTVTASPEVTAAAGADILTHAIESYTTRPYDARPKHHPPDRPAYIGANPASDVWCEKAIELVGRYLRRAVLNGMDLEARTHLALAANYAGIGFGNAGVHLPHAVAYPIAGLAETSARRLSGRPPVGAARHVGDLTAPSALPFCDRPGSLRAAELLGVPVRGARRGRTLQRCRARSRPPLRARSGIPNGLGPSATRGRRGAGGGDSSSSHASRGPHGAWARETSDAIVRSSMRIW
jgi:hypothetical protein